jgi:pimeloyl-ACP methyl ester carboxylesterase
MPSDADSGITVTAAKRRPRRIFGVGALILGVPILLWISASYYIARSLKYPDFLYRGNGQDVFGGHVPPLKRGTVTEIRNATGIEPQRYDAGMVEDEGLNARQVSVVGWYFPGRRREVVILVPAAGGTEAGLIPYVKFLHAAGYTVVATYSANNPRYGINWGLLKQKFALATARKLKSDGFEQIAVLGISEGGAGALFAQAEQPVFSAIIADSTYANLATMLTRTPAMSRLNPAFSATILWEAGWVFGRSPYVMSSQDAAAHLGGCPLLVIQNRGDPVTPRADGEAIRGAAGEAAELWIAPSDGHGDAIYEAPKEYAAHVVGFLNAIFGSETPGPKATSGARR